MKRQFVTLRRIIKTGASNFVRNAWLSAAAMAVMVVTLTIVLVSVVTSATFNHTIAQITDKINISVYLKDSVTEQQRTALMEGLRGVQNVKSVDYLSKDQALAEYRSTHQGNNDLLQAVSETGNPLPASIQIYPVNPSQIQTIKDYLDRPANVALQDPQARTSYQGDRKAAIDKIAHATDVMRKIGVGAVLLFALISMLIIFNTIQMAIFNRRDELTIMRLLGATTWYIRGPFVVESIMYGVISAVISIFIMNSVFVTASSALQASSLGLLDIEYSGQYLRQNFWLLLALQLGIGILIGAVSSVIATRRYLKFKPQARRHLNK